MDTSNAEVIRNALSSQTFVVSETVLNFDFDTVSSMTATYHHIRTIWTSVISERRGVFDSALARRGAGDRD